MARVKGTDACEVLSGYVAVPAQKDAAGSWLRASQAGVPFLPTALRGMLLLDSCVPEATLHVTLPGSAVRPALSHTTCPTHTALAFVTLAERDVLTPLCPFCSRGASLCLIRAGTEQTQRGEGGRGLRTR